MALKGQNNTIFEKSPKWSTIIENGLGHKNSAFWPWVGWHMPRWVMKPDFWENRDLWYFWPIFGKCFLRGPGSLFHWKCFYWEASKGHPLGSLQLYGVLELWPSEVSILMENLRDGRPKKRDSPRFLALFHFWCIFEGETQGHPKTQGEPTKQLWYLRYGRRKFQFHWKTWGRAEQKNRNFLKFRFSDPLKA